MQVADERANRSSPELEIRDPHLLSSLDAEAHDPIGDNEGDGGHAGGGVEGGQQLLERLETSLPGGVTEQRNILGGIEVRGRHAVGDGLEPEIGEALDGGGALGADETGVVELSVDEGDVEASGMEELG